MKILAQRPTHISAVATVLLIIKTFTVKHYDRRIWTNRTSRERERQRQTDRQRQREAQTEKETDRQTEREREMRGRERFLSIKSFICTSLRGLALLVFHHHNEHLNTHTRSKQSALTGTRIRHPSQHNSSPHEHSAVKPEHVRMGGCGTAEDKRASKRNQ